MELEYKNIDDFGTWEFGADGMINQTLDDLQDSNIRLFTETVRGHNQKIKNLKTDQVKDDINGNV